MIEAVSAVMPQAAVPQTTQIEQMVDTATVQKPNETMLAEFSKSVASSSQPAQIEAQGAAQVQAPAAIHWQSVDAAPPIGESDVAKRISEQANSLAEHLRSMDPRAGVSEAKSATDSHPISPTRDGQASTDGAKPTQQEKDKPHITDANRGAMEANIAQMEHAYVFAIEATLASRGSTEATKIFNSLLKGQ